MPESPDQPAHCSRIADLFPPSEGPPGAAAEAVPIAGNATPRRRRGPSLLASEEELIRSTWARVRASGSCAALATARGNLLASVRRLLARHLRSTRQGLMFDPVETVEDVLRRIAGSRPPRRDQNRT